MGGYSCQARLCHRLGDGAHAVGGQRDRAAADVCAIVAVSPHHARMKSSDAANIDLLKGLARHAMLERGLLPEFSAAAMTQTNAITAAAEATDAGVRDLRALPWAHARTNTTSVYTVPQVFPMLPEKLSTDPTSLAESQDRLALVVSLARKSQTTARLRNGLPLRGSSLPTALTMRRQSRQPISASPWAAAGPTLPARLPQSCC